MKRYSPKDLWFWGRGIREYRLADFPAARRLTVAKELVGEGPAFEDEFGALRLEDGTQVGTVDRDTGVVKIGRKLQEGDLPTKRGPNEATPR